MTTASRARPASRREHKVLADVLSRAFFDDPVQQWLIPDERHRYARLKRFFRAELDAYHRHNRIEVTNDLSAVAMWASPDNWKTRPIDVLRATPTMLTAFRSKALTGLGLLTAMEKVHPAEPHWYLGIIGSDPSRKGTGSGRAVIEVVLDECDEQGLPAYLESSNPVNISYYERFGFKVTDEIQVGSSPPLHPMWRQPR